MVEDEPGRRKALPAGAETAPLRPARTRRHAAELSEVAPLGALGDGLPQQAPEVGSSATLLRTLWVLTVVVLAASLGVLRATDGPTVAQQCVATALGVAFASGLGVRSGAHVSLGTALALVVGITAVVTQWAPLLGGAAVATGVLAACLAVLGTRPAATFRAVVLEVVVALLVATAGGLGVAGFAVGVNRERFAYTVLALSMVATVALVYRLGGGLHGLGRRGLILAAGAVVVLLVVLVYTAALTRYGSPELVRQVHSDQTWVRDQLGGVPHPVELLVGIPALAWGVSLRSRRRQGWWVCAFGTAATAHVVSDLLDRDDTVLSSALSAFYTLGLGLLLGYVLIRLEGALTGRGERRTPLGRGAVVLREEPPRLHPLH
jgi:hypothetical protein